MKTENFHNPHFDLPLSQLQKEKAEIIKFNAKVKSKDYIFRDIIKPISLTGINQAMNFKVNNSMQLKLF